MLALLRVKPMKAGDIARTMQGRLRTTRERLRRLHKRGFVESTADGWRATA
jgi:Mn-dependent DtxR family transcriptional regulator